MENHHDKINKYLKAIGFQHVAPMSGCHEYYKPYNKEKTIQVNALELGKITDINDEIHIGIFQNVDCELPWEHVKIYESLFKLLENEHELLGIKNLDCYHIEFRFENKVPIIIKAEKITRTEFFDKPFNSSGIYGFEKDGIQNIWIDMVIFEKDIDHPAYRLDKKLIKLGFG